jgi:hypothetical protein
MIKWNIYYCPLVNQRCHYVKDCVSRKQVVRRDESSVECTFFDVVVGVEKLEKKKR